MLQHMRVVLQDTCSRAPSQDGAHNNKVASDQQRLSIEGPTCLLRPIAVQMGVSEYKCSPHVARYHSTKASLLDRSV